REVLFWGAGALQEVIVGAVKEAPPGPGLSPLGVVAAGLEAGCGVLQERREFARQRQSIIVANAELRERELIKLASLAAAVSCALRERGVPEPAASLTAEAGMAAFRVAFERWTADDQATDVSLSQLIRESLDALRDVMTDGLALGYRVRHTAR
ncbi:MAG: hypothetical protein JO057_18515, partial [Chloroflexi bacterium]|nr:hypothetical protein [Chloroflexota bacterium]